MKKVPLVIHGNMSHNGGISTKNKMKKQMSETEPEHLATWGNFSLRHHYVDDTIIGDRPCIWVDSKVLR